MLHCKAMDVYTSSLQDNSIEEAKI